MEPSSWYLQSSISFNIKTKLFNKNQIQKSPYIHFQ